MQFNWFYRNVVLIHFEPHRLDLYYKKNKCWYGFNWFWTESSIIKLSGSAHTKSSQSVEILIKYGIDMWIEIVLNCAAIL